MDKINPDFDIPFYIFEEIIKLKEKQIDKSRQIFRIKCLLNLAVANNRLTTRQSDFLKQNYCNG